MSASCDAVRARFTRYGEELLSEAERREVRAHLAGCRSCAGEAAASDPAFLFAAAPAEEVAAEEVSRILSAVRTGIELAETERRLSRARSRGRRVAAAAAVAAFTLLLPGAVRRGAERPEQVSAAPVKQPQPAGPQDAEGSGDRQVPRLSYLPAARPSESGRFPAKATIYDWNPGAGKDEPRVVWIVDRSLDI